MLLVLLLLLLLPGLLLIDVCCLVMCQCLVPHPGLDRREWTGCLRGVALLAVRRLGDFFFNAEPFVRGVTYCVQSTHFLLSQSPSKEQGGCSELSHTRCRDTCVTVFRSSTKEIPGVRFPLWNTQRHVRFVLFNSLFFCVRRKYRYPGGLLHLECPSKNRLRPRPSHQYVLV